MMHRLPFIVKPGRWESAPVCAILLPKSPFEGDKAMERPIFQPIGTPQEELDTPALVVDLDVMEDNIDAVQGSFLNTGAVVRPHVSAHGCPEIARRQLAVGGNCGGVAVATLGEAEVFAAAGIGDILIAGRVVTPAKIRRLCNLARNGWVFLAVDSPDNVKALSEAAVANGVDIGILVEVEAGYGYGGVAPGRPALELAQAVVHAPCLEFMGLLAYEGPLPFADREERQAATRRSLQPVVDTRRLLEREGLSVTIVCAGSVHNYDAAAGISGVNEVMAGVYPLMDGETGAIRPELAPAARILATVISHPVPGRAVVDAGHKTTGPDFGVPTLEGFEGAVATRFSAEHGILELAGPATEQLRPNDKVWLTPYNLALCVNQFDYVRAVRDGKLIGYWPIAARGRWD